MHALCVNLCIHCFQAVKSAFFFLCFSALMVNDQYSRKQIPCECQEAYITFPLSTAVVNRARLVLGYSPSSGRKVFAVTVLQAPQIPG